VSEQVEAAWQFFETMSVAIDVLEVETRANRVAPDQFVGMLPEELTLAFEDLRSDLDEVAMMQISSAAEAILRRGFDARVARRAPKGQITKAFRTIERKRPNRIRLKEDIVLVWRDTLFAPHTREFMAANRFAEALEIRHWLAHGKTWTLKNAVKRTPYELRRRALDFFAVLPDFPQ
jgi:hypothetical protein